MQESTESLVWESSCGSGSVAAAWYLAGQDESRQAFHFQEPGGEINVAVRREDGRVTGCSMGRAGDPVGPVEEFVWNEQ